jgi:hypothetical protein
MFYYFADFWRQGVWCNGLDCSSLRVALLFWYSQWSALHVRKVSKQAFRLHAFHTIIRCKEYRMSPNKKICLRVNDPDVFSAPQNAQFCY